jgi:putative cardiolipin synthase
VRVRVLTNSLAANDVAAVHGGYSKYRKRLLAGGVQIWELKPGGDPTDASLLGSSGASLHAKAFAIDGHTVFVGSYNLDARSTYHNAEMGVLVRDDAFAAHFEKLFAEHIDGKQSWSVTLVDGDLQWSDGVTRQLKEPLTSLGRRFQAWLARILPVETLL